MWALNNSCYISCWETIKNGASRHLSEPNPVLIIPTKFYNPDLKRGNSNYSPSLEALATLKINSSAAAILCTAWQTAYLSVARAWGMVHFRSNSRLSKETSCKTVTYFRLERAGKCQLQGTMGSFWVDGAIYSSRPFSEGESKNRRLLMAWVQKQMRRKRFLAWKDELAST